MKDSPGRSVKSVVEGAKGETHELSGTIDI